MSADSSSDAKLLIELVASNTHQVITLGIKEQGIEQIGGALDACGFAGLLALVDLNEALFAGLGVVALDAGPHLDELGGVLAPVVLLGGTLDVGLVRIEDRVRADGGVGGGEEVGEVDGLVIIVGEGFQHFRSAAHGHVAGFCL